MHKFSENVRFDIGIYPMMSTATLRTGSSVDMAKYNNYCAVIGGAPTTATGSGSGNLTCYICQSTNDVVWPTTYLATVTISSSATLGYGTTLELRAEQMSDGYRYLRVEVLPVSGTMNVIAAANLRFNSRYEQAALPA